MSSTTSWDRPLSEVIGGGTPNTLATDEQRVTIPLTSGALLAARGVRKSYRKGPLEIPVLKGVDLETRAGEFLAIVGQSGCGKSTLLHLLGTLDAPDAGEIHFEGHRVDHLRAAGCGVLRNK